jgi:hypothetical protein
VKTELAGGSSSQDDDDTIKRLNLTPDQKQKFTDYMAMLRGEKNPEPKTQGFKWPSGGRNGSRPSALQQPTEQLDTPPIVEPPEAMPGV